MENRLTRLGVMNSAGSKLAAARFFAYLVKLQSETATLKEYLYHMWGQATPNCEILHVRSRGRKDDPIITTTATCACGHRFVVKDNGDS